MNANCLLVTLIQLILTAKSNCYLASFQHKNSDRYSNLMLKNGYLYSTGTSYVFRLYAKNISDRTSHNSYRERLIEATKAQTMNANASKPGKNYIKFLSWRPRPLTQGHEIIICGTNLGQPHLYTLKEDLENIIEFSGHLRCPGLETVNSLGLISLKKTNGIMYSGIWHSREPSKQFGIFSRYGILAFVDAI